MAKLARKLLAHYIDSAFPGASVNYVLLGDDLEEYLEEMNADVQTTQNILGVSTTSIGTYAPQASVEPYRANTTDPLFPRLDRIFNERLVLDDLKSTVIDVRLWDEISTGVYVAYREEAIIEVVSYGGDTTGVQIPFNVYKIGNRVKGQFTLATKAFVPDTGSLSTLMIDVVAGTTSTATKVSDVVGEGAGALYYKVGASLVAPYYGQSSSGFTALTLDTDIATAAGQYIVVVEIVSTAVVAASAIEPVVVGA